MSWAEVAVLEDDIKNTNNNIIPYKIDGEVINKKMYYDIPDDIFLPFDFRTTRDLFIQKKDDLYVIKNNTSTSSLSLTFYRYSNHEWTQITDFIVKDHYYNGGNMYNFMIYIASENSMMVIYSKNQSSSEAKNPNVYLYDGTAWTYNSGYGESINACISSIYNTPNPLYPSNSMGHYQSQIVDITPDNENHYGLICVGQPYAAGSNTPKWGIIRWNDTTKSFSVVYMRPMDQNKDTNTNFKPIMSYQRIIKSPFLLPDGDASSHNIFLQSEVVIRNGSTSTVENCRTIFIRFTSSATTIAFSGEGIGFSNRSNNAPQGPYINENNTYLLKNRRINDNGQGPILYGIANDMQGAIFMCTNIISSVLGLTSRLSITAEQLPNLYRGEFLWNYATTANNLDIYKYTNNTQKTSGRTMAMFFYKGFVYAFVTSTNYSVGSNTANIPMYIPLGIVSNDFCNVYPSAINSDGSLNKDVIKLRIAEE